MAVFLVNQCTFSKLPNVNNDQQQTATNTPTTKTLTTNGGSCCQSNHNSNDSTSNLSSNSVGVGLGPSNICGLKFDSLFELIHHIEDNHITDVEYSPIASSPFYSGHPQTPNQQQQPTHHPAMGPTFHGQPHGMIVPPQPVRDSTTYNDRHHMTNIINGGWLPTSCILRIFNSTHKPHKQQQHNQQQIVQQPTHQLMHKLQATQHHLQAIQQPLPQQPLPQQQPPSQLQQQQSPQPPPQIKYETGVVLSQSQDSQQQTNVITTPLGATHMVQPQMATIVQPQIQAPQGMLPQQLNVQLAQAPMQTIQQPPPLQQQNTQIIQSQPPMVTQTMSNSIHQQQNQQAQQTVASPTVVATVATPVKPTKYLKCSDCNKTYKTAHGLRAHQTSQHPNSVHTEGKIMATMPEGGDTSSGSPAPIYPPQQQLQQQSPQPPPQTKYETGVIFTQSQDSQQQTNVITAPIGATHIVQPQMATIVQPQIQTSQGMHPPQMNVQLAQAPMQPMQPQPLPTQIIQPQMVTQTISNSIQQPIQQPQQQTVAPTTVVATVTTATKPAKYLKCTDCNKTYKTAHGLRTHQMSQHPNSPHTEGKVMAIMPEGGDTSSGSPASICVPRISQDNAT